MPSPLHNWGKTVLYTSGLASYSKMYLVEVGESEDYQAHLSLAHSGSSLVFEFCFHNSDILWYNDARLLCPKGNLFGTFRRLTVNARQTATADTVLDLLRQLPPRERLRVLAQALPEVEQELSGEPRPLRSLRGLWKDLDFDITAEDIDQARREAWASFPREDI